MKNLLQWIFCRRGQHGFAKGPMGYASIGGIEEWHFFCPWCHADFGHFVEADWDKIEPRKDLNLAETLIGLRKITRHAATVGPERVVIDRDGTAVNAERALREFGIRPEVVFIRDDGWMLGALSVMEKTAETLWPKQWIAVMKRLPAEPTTWYIRPY